MKAVHLTLGGALLVGLSVSCIEKEWANATGKCRRAESEEKRCLINTLLACENLRPPQEKLPGRPDVCTNFDGLPGAIMNACRKPYVCRHPEPDQ